jgi:membrane fusion protein, multidrug efflux system
LRYKAALDQAQLNLSYTTIVAPVDGVVGKRSVQVGSNVAVGQDLLAVVPLNDVWVTANFKETQLTNMHPGTAGEDQG